MSFNYTQIFLLTWIIAFWAYYFLTYGKVEAKHEKLIKEKYKTKITWGPFFAFTFFGWTILVLIYFFNYDSANWLGKISFMDNNPIKIIAIVIMCIAFLLNILFIKHVGKSIEVGVNINEKPILVTKGIYKYIRNPAYLSFGLAVSGTFFIISNFLTLGFLIYVIIVVYGHTLEEEKKLMKIYGEEYKKYKKKTGRFLPKIN